MKFFQTIVPNTVKVLENSHFSNQLSVLLQRQTEGQALQIEYTWHGGL